MTISNESSLEVGEPPGGEEEDDAASMAISGEPGPEARGEKAQGTMVGGSRIGDNVSGQSSLAAKANEIYSSIDKTTKWPFSRSTQAASPVTYPSSYPPSDTILAVAAPVVSMAISGKPGLEVGELPSVGEEVDVASMAISGEPGLEVGEASSGCEEDAASMATSAASQAQRLASPLRHGHRFFHPVPPAAATPSRPRRAAVVALPLSAVRRLPKCPKPHRPRTTNKAAKSMHSASNKT